MNHRRWPGTARAGEVDLPDLPSNSVLLGFLRHQARLPDGPGDYVLNGWQLHTHPDLQARLQEVAPCVPVLGVYGVPVLASDGVAAAMAIGTDTLLLRLPEFPTDLELGPPLPPLTDGDWYSIDAWQADTPSAIGQQRLADLVCEALRYAGRLAVRGRTNQRSRPRRARSRPAAHERQ